NDASIKRDAVRVIVEAATDSGEIAELMSVVESRANDGAAAKRVIEPGRRAHRVLLEAGLEARVVLVQELVVTVHEHTEPRARLIGAPSQPPPSPGQPSAFAPVLLCLAEPALGVGGGGTAGRRPGRRYPTTDVGQRTGRRDAELGASVAQQAGQNIIETLCIRPRRIAE